MNDERFLTDRRSFLHAVSAGGVGLPLLSRVATTAAHVANEASPEIANQFFRVQFDAGTGRLHAWQQNGQPFLIGAVARARLASGWRSTGQQDYVRTVEVKTTQDRLGSGQQLVARCSDRRKQLNFEWRATLYEGRNALVVESICQNASRNDSLTLQSAEPLRAELSEGGACHWAGALKVLTNGYMYYDPGRVEELGRSSLHGVQSLYDMGFYRGEDEEGLVVGFLENSTADGRISARTDATVHGMPLAGGFSLDTEALYNQEMVLKPGAGATTGRVILLLAPSIFTALESYAQAVGELHQVELNNIINGWCNWFYTHEYVTEDEIVRNAEFAARHLKPFGLEYIQIDDGYQATYGEWEGGKTFPHGMKWVANKIREAGLKPGIWVAPYCIAEGTEVYQKHPEWLVRNADGGVKLCHKALETPISPGGYGTPQFMRNLYGLDITHPEAAEWMRRLFDTVANDWGYEFIKIDFVEWTLLAAERYYDPSFSKAAAYRKGFETIRQGIGPQRHLLDCGPMNNTVGVLDSTRIELDLALLTWQQYTGDFNCTAAAMAKRYYFHKRTWINDADHLGLALLTIPQAQAAASLVALSGGTMISGDRLLDLDALRLEILKKVFPAYGEAARPIDLFERDIPEVFALPVKKSFGEWLILGLFNYDEEAPTEKTMTVKRLGLDPSKTYVAYEFWSQRLHGEVRGELRVRLAPSSVALLAVHEKLGVPQVVSTDRHFAQGALELESVEWDAAANTLRGVATGPVGTMSSLAIYIPEGYRWAEDLYSYFHDFEGYTLKLMEPRILRVYAQFEARGRTSWEAKFQRHT